jgi:transposase-like protein
MRRRKFSREFKLEAVRLVKDRGVSVAQAARDLDLHENVLRNGSVKQTPIHGIRFPAMVR